MKNIFIATALFLVVGATAQTKKITTKKLVVTTVAPKLSVEDASRKNLEDLAAFTPLDSSKKALLLELFTTKNKTLVDSNMFSEERKTILAQSISAKMESVLDPVVFAKLKSNEKLYKSLIN